MRILKYPIIVFLIALAYVSCRKIEQLPVIPRVEFTSFAVFDTIDPLGNDCKGGRLKFYFEDGDGNLGLKSPEETGDMDSLNLFLTLFRKTGGIMVQVPDSGDLMKPSNYRVPYMERTGQNKILKGSIAVTFTYTFYEPADSDIFQYKFFIKDRDLNTSNIDSTGEIALSVNNLYVR